MKNVVKHAGLTFITSFTSLFLHILIPVGSPWHSMTFPGWDRMFHHHIFVRIVVFIGAATWLMKASLTMNFERSTRALSQSLAETFENFGLQGWLSAKISRFIITVTWRKSSAWMLLRICLSTKESHNRQKKTSSFITVYSDFHHLPKLSFNTSISISIYISIYLSIYIYISIYLYLYLYIRIYIYSLVP